MVFGFDSSGERLVISDGDGQLLIWSMARGRAERRLRVHDKDAIHTMLRDDTIVSLGVERSGTATPRQVLRVLALDSPSSTPVLLMGSNAATAPQVRSLETSPAGAGVLAAAADGRVLSFWGTRIRRSRVHSDPTDERLSAVDTGLGGVPASIIEIV